MPLLGHCDFVVSFQSVSQCGKMLGMHRTRQLHALANHQYTELTQALTGSHSSSEPRFRRSLGGTKVVNTKNPPEAGSLYWHWMISCAVRSAGIALEANAVVLDAGIRNGHGPDFFVAGAEVGDTDTDRAAERCITGDVQALIGDRVDAACAGIRPLCPQLAGESSGYSSMLSFCIVAQFRTTMAVR